MLGSDYPYDMGMMDCVAHVKSLSISDADKTPHSLDPRRRAVEGQSVMDVEDTQRRVSTSAILGLIADAMLKCGVPQADAAKIAELMLEADLVGADAHGVFRLSNIASG